MSLYFGSRKSTCIKQKGNYCRFYIKDSNREGKKGANYEKIGAVFAIKRVRF
jgi:hypothetical protein